MPTQMEEVDLAWALFKGLKASGMEPADYPPVNRWMAKQALAGISLPPPDQAQHGTVGCCMHALLAGQLSDSCYQRLAMLRAVVITNIDSGQSAWCIVRPFSTTPQTSHCQWRQHDKPEVISIKLPSQLLPSLSLTGRVLIAGLERQYQNNSI